MGARPLIDPLAPFQPATRAWFSAAFDAPTRPQAARLAGHRTRRIDPDPGAHRQRQDADRVPVVPRSADVHPAAAQIRALPRAVRVAAESARRGRRAQPPRAARRHRAGRRRARRRVRDARDRHPHRRHPAVRARALPARAGRHPDHHAGVALSAADLQCARGAAIDRHDHPRRNPRARADQARRAPRAVARAARSALRACAAAHRALRDAAAARRGRAFSGRRQIRNPSQVGPKIAATTPRRSPQHRD